MRRALKIGGVLALILAAAVLVLAAPGSKKTYDGDRAGAPAWARPCFTRPPRHDRQLAHRCARVRGRVLRASRSYTGELHLGVVARWRVLVVKLPDSARKPSVGSMITVVGPLVRVRHGFEEVQAFRVE
jgi:hypothetical protein